MYLQNLIFKKKTHGKKKNIPLAELTNKLILEV